MRGGGRRRYGAGYQLAITPPTTLTGAAALLRFIAEFERTEEAAVLPRLWEDGADEDKDEPLPWTFHAHVMLADALEKMAGAVMSNTVDLPTRGSRGLNT
jgi:hypothetical protein